MVQNFDGIIFKIEERRYSVTQWTVQFQSKNESFFEYKERQIEAGLYDDYFNNFDDEVHKKNDEEDKA